MKSVIHLVGNSDERINIPVISLTEKWYVPVISLTEKWSRLVDMYVLFLSLLTVLVFDI